MSTIDDAIAALKAKSIARPRVGPPTPAEQITAAEAILGCKFPPSFLTFLAQAESYQMLFWETYWVGPCDRQDILETNRQEHQEASSPLPPYLVAFFNNGAGDQVCFDTRTIDSDGEYPIVFWDHELSPEENLGHLQQIASNFAEWLMDEVKKMD